MSNEMEISGDRRARRRYPMCLPLQFQILKNSALTGGGSGTSLNLSGNGIAFATSQVLPVGSVVELEISWPGPFDELCSLKLIASGRVVRSAWDCTAITMDRHEFRTQGAKSIH